MMGEETKGGFFAQMQRSLSMPWNSDIPLGVMLAILVLFAIVVFWAIDSSRIIKNALEDAASAAL